MKVLRAALACLSLFAAAAVAHAQPEHERAFLLVANPALADPNFAGTVVLAVRVDEGGPLGVILNRPTELTLRSLYQDREDLGDRNDIVYFGGPVQPDALLFAFRSATAPPKGMAVAGDVYISGFSEVLAELLRHPEHAAEQRFYIGYTGWAEGQLEAEIRAGGWYVLPLDLKRVFAPDTGGMYEELLKRATTPRIEASLPVAAVAR
jgi:putative transcriptional regulator